MSEFAGIEGGGPQPVDAAADVPGTGDAGVDAAIDLLAAASEAQLEDRVAAYETAHRLLTDRLADLEG